MITHSFWKIYGKAFFSTPWGHYNGATVEDWEFVALLEYQYINFPNRGQIDHNRTLTAVYYIISFSEPQQWNFSIYLLQISIFTEHTPSCQMGRGRFFTYLGLPFAPSLGGLILKVLIIQIIQIVLRIQDPLCRK